MSTRLKSDDREALLKRGAVLSYEDGNAPSPKIEVGIMQKLDETRTSISNMVSSMESKLKSIEANEDDNAMGALEIAAYLRSIQGQINTIIALQKKAMQRRKYRFVHTRYYNTITTEVEEVE